MGSVGSYWGESEKDRAMETNRREQPRRFEAAVLGARGQQDQAARKDRAPFGIPDRTRPLLA